MKNGKFSRTSKRHFNPRFVALLVSVTLICATALGATIAYLIDLTDNVKNEFTPSQVTSRVDETFTNNQLKENVKIQNTGDVSAFVRAEVVVTWMNEDGDVLSYAPVEGTDYYIEYAKVDTEEAKWFTKDGYFYYKNEVAKDGLTDNLIVKAEAYNTQTGTDGKTYYVSIEILSSAIQSEGVSSTIDPGKHPVEIAWGVTYNDGNPATISK